MGVCSKCQCSISLEKISAWRIGEIFIGKNISIEWVGVNEVDKRYSGWKGMGWGLWCSCKVGHREVMEDEVMKYIGVQL